MESLSNRPPGRTESQSTTVRPANLSLIQSETQTIAPSKSSPHRESEKIAPISSSFKYVMIEQNFEKNCPIFKSYSIAQTEVGSMGYFAKFQYQPPGWLILDLGKV